MALLGICVSHSNEQKQRSPIIDWQEKEQTIEYGNRSTRRRIDFHVDCLVRLKSCSKGVKRHFHAVTVHGIAWNQLWNHFVQCFIYDSQITSMDYTGCPSEERSTTYSSSEQVLSMSHVVDVVVLPAKNEKRLPSYEECGVTLMCRASITQQYAGSPTVAHTVPATTAKQRTTGAAKIFPLSIEPRINRRLTGRSG